ncbi:YrdB family protein [Peribacillus simplex]|uniref:YrdB family protein n=1 Tax=Peribacillus simplex TaxID=1478 RepID=UPI001624B49A|nr:YrdB family protein [Peribacillus simplex]
MGFLAVLQMVNLSLRFSLEIFALAVYGQWGFKVGNAGIMKGILSIVIPLGIAVLWGLFGSPKASIQLSAKLHFVLEAFIFLVPVGLLLSLKSVKLAWIYGVIVILNRFFMWLLDQ